MNFALIAAAFAFIVPAELPDKTFISTIVLSSRFPSFPVWIGVASGLILQAGIAVLAGRLLAYAPHRVVECVVAALFLVGAAYLLFGSYSSAQQLDMQEAVPDKDHQPMSNFRVACISFGIIAVAEFGDLTQIVIANLSAKFNDPLSIFIGASLGFLAVSGAGVAVGRTLTKYVPLRIVQRISGIALLGLGTWSAIGAATA